MFSSLCSTASMRLQLMLQQPAKRMLLSSFSISFRRWRRAVDAWRLPLLNLYL
jgi:hypothetical protein